jgi:hypothetical protein
MIYSASPFDHPPPSRSHSLIVHLQSKSTASCSDAMATPAVTGINWSEQERQADISSLPSSQQEENDRCWRMGTSMDSARRARNSASSRSRSIDCSWQLQFARNVHVAFESVESDHDFMQLRPIAIRRRFPHEHSAARALCMDLSQQLHARARAISFVLLLSSCPVHPIESE